MQRPELRGLRVLLLEDLILVLIQYVRLVESFGGIPIGVGTVNVAFEAIQRGIDCAVLDFHLVGKQTSEPVALELEARGIPYCYMSAVPREFIEPKPPRHITVLSKPVREDEFTDELLRLATKTRRSP